MSPAAHHFRSAFRTKTKHGPDFFSSKKFEQPSEVVVASRSKINTASLNSVLHVILVIAWSTQKKDGGANRRDILLAILNSLVEFILPEELASFSTCSLHPCRTHGGATRMRGRTHGGGHTHGGPRMEEREQKEEEEGSSGVREEGAPMCV